MTMKLGYAVGIKECGATMYLGKSFLKELGYVEFVSDGSPEAYLSSDRETVMHLINSYQPHIDNALFVAEVDYLEEPKP